MPTVVDSLRAAADNGLGVVAQTGLNGFSVTLVTVVNDQVNFDDPTTTRTRTNTPIYVGSGTGNGLNNPHVQYVTKGDFLSTRGQTLALSGGAMTDMELILGPLAFPYNTGFQSGGFDPSNFQPGPSANANTEIYVWLQGEGLNSTNGNYFDVTEIALSGMDNIYYYVRLTARSDVVP